MSELKPVAYIYPQFGGNPPDGHYEVEGGLVLIENIDDLADWEKKAGAPLYLIPDCYALVPVGVLECARDNAQEALDFFDSVASWHESDNGPVLKHKEQVETLTKLIDKAGVLNK